MGDQDAASPNIVLITCHDLGRHLGCYGVSTVNTPNIDRLADEGVRFDRAFAVAPSCSPARAGLATGRYPHSNGVMGLTHPPFYWDLNPDERHVAAMLKSAGYETDLFGFQHVTTDKNRLGFDRAPTEGDAVRCDVKALGINVVRQVSEFLSDPPNGRPLYLEINLEEPHRPFNQGDCVPDTSKGVFVPGYLPDDEASRSEMAEFQGAIRQADLAVGEILRMIDESGMRDNTLVIFMADHGIAMPRAKCTLYDAGINVSLIMRWPAGFPGGRVFDELISNIDVLPTMLDAIRLPVPSRLQGQSFLGLLTDEPYVPRTVIFAEKTYHSYYDPMRAIRTDQFKLIRNFEAAFRVEVPADVQQGAIFRTHINLYHALEHESVELYDLESDPLELVNLANDPDFDDTRRALDARLLNWMLRSGDPLVHGPIPSPAFQQLLRELFGEEQIVARAG